jgi:aliphatic sulfonates family ABC transporter substrate-binding protein
MGDIALPRRRFLAIAGTALAASAFSERLRADDAPLRLGFPNAAWGTIGMVAEANDLFKKAGADVKVFEFDSGKSTRDAMISGRIDIGVIGSVPFIIGAAKGEMEAIALALYGSKTLSIVAGLKSGIKSVTDLKGHRIGSQIGSATDFVLKNKILPKYGLTANDVHIVNVTFPNDVSALEAGSIDAFAGPEPFVSVAEVEQIGRVVVDYSEFDLSPVILAANKTVVDGRRDAIIAFLRGWLASLKEFRDHPKEAAQIVLTHFKKQGFAANDKVIARMLSKFDVRPDFTPEVKAYLTTQSKTLVKQKKIATVPDWDKLLNHQLLAAAGAKS